MLYYAACVHCMGSQYIVGTVLSSRWFHLFLNTSRQRAHVDAKACWCICVYRSVVAHQNPWHPLCTNSAAPSIHRSGNTDPLRVCAHAPRRLLRCSAWKQPAALGGGGGRWLRELARSVETTVNGKQCRASKPAFCSHEHRASLKTPPLHPIGTTPIP